MYLDTMYLLTNYKKNHQGYQKLSLFHTFRNSLKKKGIVFCRSDIAVISKSPRAQYNSCKMT